MAVELDEYSVTVGPSTVPSGTITFEIANVGMENHVFSVLQTDLPPEELPTLPAGNADTTADEITVAGFVSEIAPEGSDQLVVDLGPGNYVLICNLVNHYSQGMTTGLEVAG